MSLLKGRQMDFDEYAAELIQAYVPEADGLSNEDALDIAFGREEEAAENLREDADGE